MARAPVKVVYLINSFALGGAERQMAELVRRLPRDRFEPALCLLAGENAYQHLLPTDQPRLVLQEGPTAGGVLRLRHWLQQEKPAIVHSFMEKSNFWNRVLAPGVGRPVIITSVRSRMMAPPYRLVEALLARRCDMVVVNSIGTRDELIRWQRVPAGKVRVIPNIVDFSRFRAGSPETREAARRGLSLAGPTFLVPGRISVSKHQLGLVLAAGRLKRAGRLPRDVRFLLAGRVFDSSVARLLPALTRLQGVEEHFRYLGPARDVIELYTAADWVLLPSLYEGLPNAALEAHACERPLLMSHAANLDGILEPGVTGIEFATGWIAPLSGAIQAALATDRSTAAEMGRRGRLRVLARFDPGDALRAVTDLYEELLQRRGNGRGNA